MLDQRDRAVPHQAAIILMPAVFALAIVVAPAIGSLGLGWLVGFSFMEVVCLALPAVVAARVTTGSVRAALALRWPRPRVLIGAVLFGASFWYLSLTLMVPILGDHSSTSDRELAGVLAEDYPLVLKWLVLALTPAVCEELLVRGAIARGLTGRFGGLAAVLLSSGFFALLHLSLARTLPTLALGAFLAIIVLRTGSLVPAIVVHALNNTTALLIGDPLAGVLVAIAAYPALAFGCATLLSGAGLVLMLSVGEPPDHGKYSS